MKNIFATVFLLLLCFASYQLFGINKTLKDLDQHVTTWDAAITNTAE